MIERQNLDTRHVDVVIAGGGLVGGALATAIASHPLARGLSIAIVDPSPPSLERTPAVSLRTSTITPSSKDFLEDIGVWPRIPATRIAAFSSMFLWDHPPPLPSAAATHSGLVSSPPGTLYFEAAEVGADVLGYVVDNDILRYAIFSRMAELAESGDADLSVISSGVRSIDFSDDAAAEGGTSEQARSGGSVSVPWPKVRLETGEVVQTRLLVACDGSRSRIRSLAGFDWFSRSYNQNAVVANVNLRQATSTAFQRFLSTGPLAVLPVASSDSTEPMGNIIWTTTSAEAAALAAADDAVFLNELNVALRDHEDDEAFPQQPQMPFVTVGGQSGAPPRDSASVLWQTAAQGLSAVLPRVGLMSESGLAQPAVMEPPEATAIVGKRGQFPLSLGHAPRYVSPERRTVLVGDAAHNVHPLAGQGVNLGFGDVQSLADCLASAAATGRDVGGEDGAPLMRYQSERMAANVCMLGLLNGIQGIFNTNSPALFRDIRRLGMSTLNAIGPAKKVILRAMR